MGIDNRNKIKILNHEQI